MGPLDLMADYDEESLRAMIAPLLDHRVGSRSLTTRHRTPTGASSRSRWWSSAPTSVAGSSPDVVALVRDITERLETEAPAA
jgi:PAS domain-containing protein